MLNFYIFGGGVPFPPFPSFPSFPKACPHKSQCLSNKIDKLDFNLILKNAVLPSTKMTSTIKVFYTHKPAACHMTATSLLYFCVEGYMELCWL